MRSVRFLALTSLLLPAAFWGCAGNVAGDGEIGGDEVCDDGNTRAGDYCSPDGLAVTGLCGDGLLQDNERCDDGNALPGDHCAADCLSVTGGCGDAIVQANEACDDGNVSEGDHCAGDCLRIIGLCGDGIVQENERCDDGNAFEGDHCAADCLDVTGRCGDGAVQGFEACDDGNTDWDDYCSADCGLVTGACGDGTLETYEACDDGNTAGGDYCTGCHEAPGYCGDGRVQPRFEGCDDGNSDDGGNGCATDCSCNNVCGNGDLDECEICDDGNTDSGDHCAPDCRSVIGRCGDRVIHRNEACDDGNDLYGDYCAADCTYVTGFCGDAEVQINERCDDGNSDQGDYCSSDCLTVTGNCGDWMLQINETCDDGNSDEDDYCYDACLTIGYCGDSVTELAFEQCDDGDSEDVRNGCSAACRRNDSCGNSIHESLYEECDDGDTEVGDGCDLGCTATRCGNGIRTAGEMCDDGDQDDNDGCDSLCRAVIPTGGNTAVLDFDAASDGSLFVVLFDYNSYTLLGRCYNPDLTVRRADFVIASIGNNLYDGNRTQVVVSRRSGKALVSWIRYPAANDYNHRYYQWRLYDSSCQPITAVTDFPGNQGPDYVYDTAIDDAGNFTLLWQNDTAPLGAHLSFYDANGSKLGSDLLVDNAGRCGNYYGKKVALDRSTGAGVVTCQKHQSDPIYWRRFDASHAMTEPWRAVAESVGNSAWNESHVTGMLDGGAFAVEWATYAKDRYEAVIFGADGASVGHYVLAPSIGYAYSSFYGGGLRIETFGNRFIFRTVDPTATYWLYSGAGQVAGCDQSSSLEPRTLRSNGRATYLRSGSAFAVDSLDFNRWRGCGPATCGDGVSDVVGEECDDGNLAPFDGCDQHCKRERCGDSQVTLRETCDDGNSRAGDGCNASCQIEPQAPPAEPITDNQQGIDDFDVAADGGVIVVHENEGMAFATCYKPDKTLLRAKFPVSTAGAVGYGVTAYRARESGRTVVTWMNSSGYAGGGALLDPSCFIVRLIPKLFPADRILYDAAIDESGKFALASWYSASYLTFFNAQGDSVTELTLGPSDVCSSYGHRVAMAGGRGVFSCQGHASSPVRYRRFRVGDSFSDPVFLDPDWVNIPESENNNSSYSRTHLTAVNARGAWMVEWVNQARRRYEGKFFPAGDMATEPAVHTILGPHLGPYAYSTFESTHERLDIRQSSYVLRSNGMPKNNVWLFSEDGVIQGCDRTTYGTNGVRVTPQQTYVSTGSSILPGELDFTEWDGCARPTCGDGDADTGEECDDGGRRSFDGCDEYCKNEFCSDRVVSGTESCDDGNRTNGDGCNSSCQLEARAPFTSPIQVPNNNVVTNLTLYDFDAASDGTLVGVYRDNEGAIFAACYNPDKTMKRAPFPVGYPDTRGEFPIVTVSPKSRKALVVWWVTDPTILYLKGSMLDENCRVVRRDFPVISSSHRYFQAAIDDNGNSAVVGRWNDLRVAFFDPSGNQVGTELTLPPYGSGAATRVAVNPSTGAGIVTMQNSGGSQIAYRRFAADHNWIEDFRYLNVGTLWDGFQHTVGMNRAGQFVFLWRNYVSGGPNPIKASFFDADGSTTAANVTVSARVRSGEGLPYYTFYWPNQEIQIKGDNFVLGEAYYTQSGDASQNYFVYTPAGSLVSSYENVQGASQGLYLILDGVGTSYFRQYNSIYFGTGRL